MSTHKIPVVIPPDHRLVVEVPKAIRSGPAELILVVPEDPPKAGPPASGGEALARWDAVMTSLSEDSRPFHSLTPSEKRKRHRMLRGIGKGVLPSSNAVARAKRHEVEIEEAKFGR